MPEINNHTSKMINVLIIAASTLIVSISLGINAVVFPVSLERLGISTQLIGIVLALDVVASIIIAFTLTRILRSLGPRNALLLSTLLRVPPIIALNFLDSVYAWGVLVFIHGVGFNTFYIITQTWVNAIPTAKTRGLMIGIYSTAFSVGLALGPVTMGFAGVLSPLLEYSNQFVAYMQDTHNPNFDFLFSDVDLHLAILASTILSFIGALPLVFIFGVIPKFALKEEIKIWPTITSAKDPMFAIALAGVSASGVMTFITIYGLRNGLVLEDAALLLSFFMFGSLFLEIPFARLSDIYNRRFILAVAAFLSMCCAAFLPIVIYVNYQAWLLAFVWGGVIGSINSITLAMLGDQFRNGKIVAANAGHEIMESAGGTIGILMIGFCMDFLGSDGLPYVIMFASVLFFSFLLARYEVV